MRMRAIMRAMKGWMIARARVGPALLRGRVKTAGRPTRYGSSQVGSTNTMPGPDQDEDDSSNNSKSGGDSRSTFFKVFETAATTFASIAVLGLAGYSYHLYYKALVLRKIEKAFAPGDPMLDLASPPGPHVHATDEAADDPDNWIARPEQAKIDGIIKGESKGRYYLLVGEKGTGKSSMILEAMRKIDGEGVSMFEAHADLEIFRIRLGKALNYEFHEDYIGSLFSIRGPRDTTALLDIERAFNKLEKVALAHRDKNQKQTARKGPLVLIINCAHLIRDDEDGNDLIELMQQRAEQWAAANLITMIFNSDDYWVYERLKRYATRMEVIPVLDLNKERAIAALDRYRAKYFPEQKRDPEILKQVYDMVGGRLNFLSRVAKSSDMLRMCHQIKESEKTWFLNRCGILGEEMDDDVMDQQKYASAAMVLAKALVDMDKDMETSYDEEKGHILPQIPLYRARQIMTRADFIQSYDHDNIFTIDSNAMVRADSIPMMHAFKEICAEEGFDDYLEATLDRISAIESINRTKELTFKDLWFEQKGEQRGKYSFTMRDPKGRETGTVEMRVQPDKSADDSDD
ncbi:hypothetical protein ABEF92_002792 [Exophiala dermatitidis]|uniref:Orc1-like AAA ATPase domain-containing protein n=1 Tax=Exophiala dermatitidis (strain ATCC 34100 / CBS 525.76 / NIH/UT8656) TaxID=858893 RepID=H6BR07_EXODN|nr:uncharacterized protein HMPREF1120_02809 [Exophiala dermatitidis NIH/UT8656]EHY54642.1 hypothetical protein HMPREF1120_02809 [Exophiala dermatitidis NIH/UT8656]